MPPLLIVGAGIGGLTLALSLQARGIRCVVMESARAIQPLGVGINLLPHGTRVLTELGLGDALADVAVSTRALEYRARDGRLIHADLRGAYAGMPFPSYSVHRGDLHSMLHDALVARHGADSVVAGMRLLDYEQHGDSVTAVFERRTDGATVRLQAPALIGADGILSTVRRRMYPGEGPPRSAGIDMWRGLTWAPPFLDGETMVIVGVHECKFVAYPVRRRLRDGLQLINWVAEHGQTFGVPRAYGDWNDRADPADFIDRFGHYRFDFLDVPALIGGAESCFAYPMVDRDPVSRWVDGRVALIGDAAHPMYPIGANGASQAILDAEALAESIAATPDELFQALQSYQHRRLDAANAVVLANRERGPERLLQMADARLERRDVPLLDAAEIEAITIGYRRTAGFERDALLAMAARPRLWPARQ